MFVSKKKYRLTVIFLAAALAVAGIAYFRADARADTLDRSAAVSRDQAFAELTAAVGQLDSSLKKTLCSSSPALVSSTCAQGYAQCAAAGQAISGLPYGSIELEHTAAYLTKTGDYLFYLSRACANGHELTDDERNSLSQLSKSAEQVSDTLTDLTARILSGQITTAELDSAEAAVSQAEDSLVDTGLAASFKAMESEFPELPALIYDGPFSQHLSRPDPALLRGLDEVDEEGALKSAAKFLGTEPELLRLEYRRDGEIPVYVITRQNGNQAETVEVSCTGGKIVYFGVSRETSEGRVDPQDAVRTAARFLERQGFTSMASTYWTTDGGEAVINFAYEDNGVICYPDLVKVTVALDTGAVTGLEAKGYTMCHTSRSLTPPESPTSPHLAPGLTVESSRPALIPSSGKYELLCTEYLCRTPEGQRALVYVNAATGQEEKILLLLESEAGTLTV